MINMLRIKQIDKDIELNRKYISAVNYAIKEKEKQLGRHLTGQELQAINKQIEELGWKVGSDNNGNR